MWSCDFSSEENTNSTNDKGVDTLKYLNFFTDSLVEITTPETIRSIQFSCQPIESQHVYFLDPTNGSFSSFNTLNYELINHCQINNFDYAENFVVSEEDSTFYIFNEEISNLVVYSFTGEIVELIELPDLGNTGAFYASFSFKPYIVDKNIYIFRYPFVKNNNKNPEFYTAKLEAKVDLVNNTLEFLEIEYPENYKSNFYSWNYLPERYIDSDSTFCYTYPYNDTVFRYNLNSNRVNKIFCGSKNKDLVFRYIAFDQLDSINEIAFDDLYNKNPFYSQVEKMSFSNKYIRKLYRKDVETNKIQETLILFDSNLQYIGESQEGWKSQIIVDSPHGLLNIKGDLMNNRLLISKLKWN